MNTFIEPLHSSTSSFQMLAMEALQKYMNALINNGAIEGRLGEQTIIPELEPAFEIIHKVLAGAELDVNIHVIREPDTEVLSGLDGRRREAEEQANRLNKSVGMLYMGP